MQLISSQPTDRGTIAVTLGDDHGITHLEARPDQLARLATAMEQVSLLARVSEHETSWLADVVVGRDLVRLGIGPGGRVRMVVGPA